MLNPITFSIPHEKIVNSIPEKSKILSDLIPGKIETYIYNNEKEYYDEYKKSYFAITQKKAGWDCMRHYEIIANGCIPYFINIEECPNNTIALLPKELLKQGNKLYEKFSRKKINDITNDYIIEYNILLHQLLEYAKNNLTTEKMAQYILSKTNFQDCSKVLYLSQCIKPDYLRCITLHGFKKLLGSKCHDYPKIPHIYHSNDINYENLYGKGISYTNLLDISFHDNEQDTTIEEDINNKKYDIIIYGSYHRGMPFYDLISKIYNPNEIILLCGEDIHQCDYRKWTEKGHYVFVREL